MHLRVDLVGPGENAAGEIFHFGVALLREELGDALAAAAGAALHDDLAVAVDLGETLRHLALRNERAADVGDLIFVRLANVEDENIFARIAAAASVPAQLICGIPFFKVFLLGRFGRDAAELLVINEFA